MIPTIQNDALEAAIRRFWEVFPPVRDRIHGHLQVILMNQSEVTVEQFQILRNIRHGSQTVSDLAKMKSITKSAVSQSVENLVKKGYITRAASPDDRRRIRLELTPAGQELVALIYQRNRAWMAEKLKDASSDQIQDLITAMDLLEIAFLKE